MKSKTRRKGTPTRLLFMLASPLVLCACLCSCNVTRVVTNESKYTTRGDTAVVITVKTVETYDAKKNLNY